MNLITWNVNGLRAALKKGFVDWLAAAQPDVVCLQEVRAAPEQLAGEPWRALGYQATWNPAARPGYSGVALLLRRPPLAVHAGLGDPEFDAEGRVLVAEYPGFTLLNSYFPSGQRDRGRVAFKLRFYAALLDLLDRLHAQGRQVVVCGDFNTAHRAIDLARPRENARTSGFLPEERAWIDIYLSHGLVDVFRALHPGEPGHYTWWSTVTRARARNVGWRLDYFLVSEGLLGAVRAAEILPLVAGSDHCPVLLEIGPAH
ncbi:MAG TPA: exodeoxyribonuclease III [Anaerolineae bacterium]|nr:exodeoxyribonuclease III [Anaerolineae bacterium]HOR00108.1 exodeoxyribonuclease III [Anaerolineae bacterium]HPL28333.1 exodeoxyribonuclease III [Anaerolineae bacterium]